MLAPQRLLLRPPAAVIAPGPSYDPATVALLSAMTVAPSTALAGKIDAFITGLKTTAHSAGAGATLWSKLDRLQRFDVHDRQAARLDWKNPTTKGVIENGDLGWAAWQGFNPNTPSTATRLDLGEALAANPNFTQNDAHFSVDLYAYVFDPWNGLVQDQTINKTGLGQSSATGAFYFGINDTILNNSTAADTIVANWTTLLTVTRTSSTTKRLIRGATEFALIAKASAAPGNVNCWLLYGDTANYYQPPVSGVVMRGFNSGAGWADTDVAAFFALRNSFIAP